MTLNQNSNGNYATNFITNQNMYQTFYYTTNSNSTTTNTVWTTIPYEPFDSNYAYNSVITWNYSPNDYGLREYMFANNLYVEISDILLEENRFVDSDQEFEDNLYRLTLDLLYDYIKQERAFNDFFNEKLFKYGEVNKIIQEIIDRYHTIIMEEC